MQFSPTKFPQLNPPPPPPICYAAPVMGIILGNTQVLFDQQVVPSDTAGRNGMSQAGSSTCRSCTRCSLHFGLLVYGDFR